MRRLPVAIIALMLAALNGCASQTAHLNLSFDKVQTIVPGETHRGDILDMFGAPIDETVERWLYLGTHTAREATEERRLFVRFASDRTVAFYLWIMMKKRAEGARMVYDDPIPSTDCARAWRGQRVLRPKITKTLGPPNKAEPNRMIYLHQIRGRAGKTADETLALTFDEGAQLIDWLYLDLMAGVLTDKTVRQATPENLRNDRDVESLLGPPACVLEGLDWLWRVADGKLLRVTLDAKGAVTKIDTLTVDAFSRQLDPKTMRFAEIKALWPEREQNPR